MLGQAVHVPWLRSYVLWYKALSVPRTNMSMRPSPHDTAAGSEAIGLDPSRSKSDQPPSYALCHKASSVPLTKTSRRPAPQEHTPGPEASALSAPTRS